jgi:hypothetical protein
MTDKKTFEEWLNEAEWPTPEESAQYKAEREATKGTMTESALMMEDGVIAVQTWCYSQDGSVGDGSLVFTPNDKDYEEAKKQYGLRKPGDHYCIIKKWVDGEWAVEKEVWPDQSKPGKAKSA